MEDWHSLGIVLLLAVLVVAAVGHDTWRIAQTVKISLRNQLFLIRARGARRALHRALVGRGLRPATIRTFLGLADPSRLAVVVVLATDSALDALQGSHLEPEFQNLWLRTLRESGYPHGVSASSLTFHSLEQIIRVGGYHTYFT